MSASKAIENRWSETTKALLLGFVAMATLLHQSFVHGAGFVPPGASLLMLWVAVAGIVSYAMLRRDLAAGYWLASMTGLLYLASTGVLAAGLLGPLPSGGPLFGLVIGPIAQVVFAVILIWSAYLGLSERAASGEDTTAGGDAPADA
jgi:uncharacterized protein YqgC (DUF456 family)